MTWAVATYRAESDQTCKLHETMWVSVQLPATKLFPLSDSTASLFDHCCMIQVPTDRHVCALEISSNRMPPFLFLFQPQRKAA